MRRHSGFYATLAMFLLLASGCGGSGPYIWVHDLHDDAPATSEYVIAPGDTVAVHVFNQDAMSTRGRVRSDGKIAIPLVGDVVVGGKSPAAVSRDIESRAKDYVVAPKVTVTVDEFQPTSVAVVGEVIHAGIFTVDPSSGVLQALALAGGLTDYASRDCIFVVRRAPAERIRFTYAALTRGEAHAATFHLRAGDVVVVE